MRALDVVFLPAIVIQQPLAWQTADTVPSTATVWPEYFCGSSEMVSNDRHSVPCGICSPLNSILYWP